MSIQDVGILLSLLLTISGWGITAYYQRRILERQISADKERLAQQFAHEKEMLELQYQQKMREYEQQEIHKQKLESMQTVRDKMLDAFSRTLHLNRRLLTYPDFNTMSPSQLKDAIANLEFSDSQKEELLKAKNKADYYIDTQFWYDLDKAERSINDLHNFIVKRKMLLDQELTTRLNSIDQLLIETLDAIRIGKQARDNKMRFDAGDNLNKKGSILIEEIEGIIQSKLS
jgi:hypothetical protein